MSNRCSMPDIMRTDDGKERKVGVEIELSGLGYEALVSLSSRLLGGEAKPVSRYVSEISTEVGSFTIELDSDPIKDLDL